MWRTVPYSDGKRRHRQMYMHGCKDTHNRKIVCHIVSVFVLSAYDQVLEKAVTCKSLCGCCITYFVKIVEFDPDTVKEFLCCFSGNNTLINVCLIIRIHILVKTSRRNRMSAGFNLQKLLYEPERLTCLVEAGRSVCRYTAAVL